MAIPYMGSKAAFCGQIFNVINNFDKNNNKILVDCFCGGFSVSEYFIKKGWTVISNDKNKFNIALIKKVTSKEGLGNIEKEFITKDKFNDVKNNPDKYPDWYVGYVLSVWSFGNKQDSYLFSKENEVLKSKAHELVVNCNNEAMSGILPKACIDYVLGFDTWGKRRMALQSYIRKNKKHFELEQLQRLEQLEWLQIYCRDYKDVPIPEKAIVYCDPPYEKTAKYLVKEFDITEFWEWARHISKTNSIYISSYKCPDDFCSVYSFTDVKKLSQNKATISKECLFVPKTQLKKKFNK